MGFLKSQRARGKVRQWFNTQAFAATVAQAVLAVWFLLTWTEPGQTSVGLWERVVVTEQCVYMCAVVLYLYWHYRTRGVDGASARNRTETTP